jgi:hypothetical protein
VNLTSGQSLVAIARNAESLDVANGSPDDDGPDNDGAGAAGDSEDEGAADNGIGAGGLTDTVSGDDDPGDGTA